MNAVANFQVAPPGAILLEIESIEMESIQWLWKGWLAQGKFHLLAGAPGTGKTTIALAYAAAISAGDHWPDGTRAPIGNVLIWTSEDGIADTIKPRLVRMGAELTHIKVVHQQREADGKCRPFNPATDMPSLREAARSIHEGAALLIIDPIVAAIGSKANSHNNAETRNSLQPVVDFAEATGAAVVGITHFTKGTAGKDPTERVTGSLAFGAVARVVMLAAKNEYGAPPRILTRSKSNIGRDGGFGYDLVAAPLVEHQDIIATRVVWHGAIDGSAKELLASAEGKGGGGGEKASKFGQAKQFLAAALAKGERPQSEIEAEAEGVGISARTLIRAAKDGVSKRKKGRYGQWFWKAG